MFQDKSLLAVAEAVKKVWAEGLTDKQKKIDKNHNNKIDGQDLAILRKEGWDDMMKAVKDRAAPQPNGGAGKKQGSAYGGSKQKDEKPLKEEDAYSKDRYAVKDGKAMKDNPTHKGHPDYADKPHHVWATSPEEAMKKKKTVKEEASQAEFTAELKKAQAKAQGKEKADVAKPAVQAVQNEQTHTQIEVFNLNDANGVKRSVIDLEEAKSGYDLYHSMYSGAVQHGLAHHEKSGLTVDPDDYHDKVTVGPKKPSEGKTVSHNIKATNAKGESHMIHMQVHNKGGNKPYELNTYSSKVPKKQVKEEHTGLHPDAQKVLKHIKPEHQSKYHADLTPKTYKGDYADRSAILDAAERAGHLKEEVEQIDERHLTSAESEKMEKNVKSMKKGLSGFKERYGKDAKSVMYATATKQAKGE